MATIQFKKGEEIGRYQGAPILSSGDWDLDKKKLSEKLPGFDVVGLESTLQKVFADRENGITPEVRSRYDELVSNPITSVQQKRAFDALTKAHPYLLGPKPPTKAPKTPEGAIGEKADIKKYIDDIVQAGNAKRLLENINESKKNVDTGPFAGRIFDASIPQFDEGGKNIPPGIIDGIISTLAPKKTGDMRTLAANIQAYTDYAQSKGGKALTKPEKDPLFSQIGTPYDDDPVFEKIQSQAMGNVDQYTLQKIKALKSLGLDENALMNLASSAMKESGGDSTLAPASTSYLQKLLKSGPANQPKQIDADTAKTFLQQAGGDKDKAREMAKQAGFIF